MQQSEVDELKSYIKYDAFHNIEEFFQKHDINEIRALNFGNGNDVFNFACSVNAVRIVSAIVNKDLNLESDGVNDYGYNGLHTACSLSGNMENGELIRILLEAGFNPNLPAKPHVSDFMANSTHTPMNLYVHFSACAHEDIVRLMLRAGGNPNTLCLRPIFTPIMVEVIGFLKIEVLKHLLEFDAKVDFVDRDNNTVLHLALCKQSFFKKNSKKNSKLCAEIIVLLINAGALLDKKNNKGETVLMLAGENKHSEVARCISKFINGIQRGKTLSQITEEIGYKKVAEYIKELPMLKQKALAEKEQFSKKISQTIQPINKVQFDNQAQSISIEPNNYEQNPTDSSAVIEIKIKPQKTSKLSNYNTAGKVITIILLVILLTTFVSAVVLFVIRYNPIYIPIILICVSAVASLFLILSLTVITGCILPLDKEIHDKVHTKLNETEERAAVAVGFFVDTAESLFPEDKMCTLDASL